MVKENKRLTRCFLFYAVSRTQSPTNTRLTVFYSAKLVTTIPTGKWVTVTISMI